MGKRRQCFKSPQAGLYIVGEGITEKYYFDHLKSIFGYKCVVKPRFFSNDCIEKIEKEIENLLRGDIFIICVFDADVSNRNESENEKLVNLKSKYRTNKNILFCDSMPSIEYWFLIHFRDTCPSHTYSRETTRLLKRYITNYEKTEKFLEKEQWVKEMSLINGDINAAINVAKKYRPSAASYTKLDLAVDKLKKTIS